MMRVALKFSRGGMTRFLSHLDMQRTFARTLRRTGLNVKTSSGFNPHIVMSFASALSVGMETCGDYLEFTLLEDVNIDRVIRLMNECLPEDIRVTEGYVLNDGAKKIMSMVYAAEIEYLPEKNDGEAFKAAALEFLKNGEWYIDKKGKRTSRRVDIMPLIYSADIADTVSMKLAHSNEASLNPFVLLKEICSLAGKEFNIKVIRKELCTEDLRPLNDLLK